MATIPVLDPRPETCLILAGLIQDQMNLAPGVVAVYNQKRRLPAESGLFIDVAIIATKPIGNSYRTANDPITGNLIEIHSMNLQEIYQIDIFSQDASARLRRYELLAALSGIASQQLQEKYSFQIARIPQSFVDVAELEASSRLNRYAITIPITASQEIRREAIPFTAFSIPPELHVNP